MSYLKKLYYKIFPQYERLELQVFSWEHADRLIKENANKPPEEQWVLAIPEEDNNHFIGVVWLERRKRITE